METKRFSKLDNGFICENCGKEVPPLDIPREIIARIVFTQSMLI